MENFVDDYYSVERFRITYSRRVEPIGDRSFWPSVDFASGVFAPIAIRGLGRQRKIELKAASRVGVLEKVVATTMKKRESDSKGNTLVLIVVN
jgi:hypothetical protein